MQNTSQKFLTVEYLMADILPFRLHFHLKAHMLVLRNSCNYIRLIFCNLFRNETIMFIQDITVVLGG